MHAICYIWCILHNSWQNCTPSAKARKVRGSLEGNKGEGRAFPRWAVEPKSSQKSLWDTTRGGLHLPCTSPVSLTTKLNGPWLVNWLSSSSLCFLIALRSWAIVWAQAIPWFSTQKSGVCTTAVRIPCQVHNLSLQNRQVWCPYSVLKVRICASALRQLACRDQTFVPPWYRSVNLCLRKKYLHEALQCIPDVLGVEEIWFQKIAFTHIHLQQ